MIPRQCFPFSETLSLWALRRTSQVPRLIFRHAPSPITPDSPTGSFARLFPVDGGLHHIRKAGRCQLRVTRPKQVRLRWARVFIVWVVTPPIALVTLYKEPVLLPTFGYPPVTDRDYIMNEQFICLTLFSQKAWPSVPDRHEKALTSSH